MRGFPSAYFSCLLSPASNLQLVLFKIRIPVILNPYQCFSTSPPFPDVLVWCIFSESLLRVHFQSIVPHLFYPCPFAFHSCFPILVLAFILSFVFAFSSCMDSDSLPFASFLSSLASFLGLPLVTLLSLLLSWFSCAPSYCNSSPFHLSSPVSTLRRTLNLARSLSIILFFSPRFYISILYALFVCFSLPMFSGGHYTLLFLIAPLFYPTSRISSLLEHVSCVLSHLVPWVGIGIQLCPLSSSSYYLMNSRLTSVCLSVSPLEFVVRCL